jgi:hypothetical protein
VVKWDGAAWVALKNGPLGQEEAVLRQQPIASLEVLDPDGSGPGRECLYAGLASDQFCAFSTSEGSVFPRWDGQTWTADSPVRMEPYPRLRW